MATKKAAKAAPKKTTATKKAAATKTAATPAAPKKAATKKAASHEEISKLAEQMWIERGRPEGSAHVDWHAAEHKLKS